jgi:hypothetical protein
VIGPGLGASGVVHEAEDRRRELSYGLALATAAEPVTLPSAPRRSASSPARATRCGSRSRSCSCATGASPWRTPTCRSALADALAYGGHRRQANWCTFSAWSSKTIGGWIEDDPEVDPLDPDWVPAWVSEQLTDVLRWVLTRDNGATYRALAAGNRFVFLEIGLAFALFLEAFDPGAHRRGRGGLGPLWGRMEAVLAEQARLDPSWMLTRTRPPPSSSWACASTSKPCSPGIPRSGPSGCWPATC